MIQCLTEMWGIFIEISFPSCLNCSSSGAETRILCVYVPLGFALGTLGFARGTLGFARGALGFARGALGFARGALGFARGAI